MDDRQIMAYWQDDEAVLLWEPVFSLDNALALQDTVGVNSPRLLWVDSEEAAYNLLCDCYPGRTVYPRVVRVHAGKILAMPEKWAFLEEARVDAKIINEVLDQGCRVLLHNEQGPYWSPYKNSFDTCNVPGILNSNHRWYGLYRRRGVRSPVFDQAKALDVIMRFYYDALHQLEQELPKLECIRHTGACTEDKRTTAVCGRVWDLLHDWRVVFGKQDRGYRKLKTWREMLELIGNRRAMRKLHQYAQDDDIRALLQEIRAAQRLPTNRIKGVESATKWPIPNAKTPARVEDIVSRRKRKIAAPVAEATN